MEGATSRPRAAPEPGKTDLRAPDVLRDPHPVYERLRRQGPVVWNDSLNGWVVTGHPEVRRLLRDPRMTVEKLQPFEERAARRLGPEGHAHVRTLAKALSDWMVFSDPPRHDVLRQALQRAFLARDIPRLTPRIEAVVGELLDRAAPPGVEQGEMELVSAFAYPLPAIVIAELFGLDRSEHEQLKRWSDDLGRFVLGSTERTGLYARAAGAVREMSERFRALVAEHRGPAGRERETFTSVLVRDGSALTDDEIVHTLILVLFAGHETTTNLIANGVRLLALDPGLMAELRREPSRIEAAVEEFLRLDGPVQMLVRLPREPVRIGGVEIGAGETVYLVLNAANRDPRVFDAPEALSLERGRARHVSFGPGVHFCLGAPLARLEGRIAFEGLLERFESLELGGEIEWRPELIIHGPRRLPVRYRRAANGQGGPRAPRRGGAAGSAPGV